MQLEQFTGLMARLTARVAGKPLDAVLEHELNQALPATSAPYHELFSACRAGIAAGWLCNREHGGIKFGRVIKPDVRTHGFSVDVVEMHDVVGPHHTHPNGEIDLIMPLTAGAEFDRRGAGWCVYPPGSAHNPTVTGGRALILYLLPEGRIEFTKG